MRLEYNEEQEKELRIAEIEAILTNGLYENKAEEQCLNIELQFLQGSQDGISMGPMKIVFKEVDHTLVEDPNGNLFEWHPDSNEVFLFHKNTDEWTKITGTIAGAVKMLCRSKDTYKGE